MVSLNVPQRFGQDDPPNVKRSGMISKLFRTQQLSRADSRLIWQRRNAASKSNFEMKIGVDGCRNLRLIIYLMIRLMQ